MSGVIIRLSEWVDANLGGLYPSRYEAYLAESKYYQHIAVKWLDVEIEANAEERLPPLRDIRGHRNREVYYYVKDTNAYWDKVLADSYGWPGACI